MTLGDYVDMCYNMRGKELDRIKTYSSLVNDLHFKELAHFVWRLGATRAAANTVIFAMLTVPSLRRVSTVSAIKAPNTIKKDISPRCISPHEILHTIVASSNVQNPLQSQHAFHRLHQLDMPVSRPLYAMMLNRETIVTRVHAELQLADKFSRT